MARQRKFHGDPAVHAAMEREIAIALLTALGVPTMRYRVASIREELMYGVDGWLLGGSSFVHHESRFIDAGVQVKDRPGLNPARHHDVLVAVDKIAKLDRWARTTHRPSLFVVRPSSGDLWVLPLWCTQEPRDEWPVLYGGRTVTTRDAGDIEPVFAVPNSRFMIVPPGTDGLWARIIETNPASVRV